MLFSAAKQNGKALLESSLMLLVYAHLEAPCAAHSAQGRLYLQLGLGAFADLTDEEFRERYLGQRSSNPLLRWLFQIL